MAQDQRSRDLERSPRAMPYAFKVRSSKWFVVFTVSASVFTDIFLYGVGVPLYPFALHSRCGVPLQDRQYWVSVLLAVYGAALTAGSPICGYFADKLETRRIPYLLGLLFLAASTALLAVGTNIGLLVVGRILQGLSAAIVWTVGLALLVDKVGPDNVGQYMGYVSLGMTLAIMIAPLLGGVVFAAGEDNASYEGVFAMCWGFIGIDIFLRIIMIEERTARFWTEEAERINERPESTIANEAISRSLEGPVNNKEPPVGVDLHKEEDEVKGTVLQDSIHTYEYQSPIKDATEDSNELDQKEQQIGGVSPCESELTTEPTNANKSRIPVMFRLLSSRRLLVAFFASFAQAVLLIAFDSTLPLRVKHIFHWDSLGAGLIFLPISIPSFAAPLVGWLCDRTGPRLLASAGFLFSAPFIVLLRLVTEDTIGQKVLLCVLLFFMGFCVTMGFTCIMAEVSYVIAAKQKANPHHYGKQGAYASGYAIFNICFALGCLVGPIWGGTVIRTAGWGTMTWTLGLFSAVTAVPVLLFTGGWIGKAKPSTSRDEANDE